MNLKRPSFRRGGSTGIGQLTPRIKAKIGFPGFEFLEAGIQNELRSQMKPPSGKGLTKGTRGARLLSQLRNLSIPSASTAGLMSLPFVLPAGIAYANKPKTLAEKKVMQEYGPIDETFFQYDEYDADRKAASKIGDEISFKDAIFMDTETGKYPKVLGRTEDREIQEELYGTDAGFLPNAGPKEVNMEEIVDTVVADKKTDTDDDAPKEKTFDSIYEEEKSKLEKLLGDDDDRGMAAIALSEAIGTPGTIADKAAVLNKSLLGIMKGKKKDKKDIAKLAYTATKEIEKAKIAAGKEGFSERNYKRLTQLQKIIGDTTGTYSEAEKKNAAAEYAIAEKVISSIGGKKDKTGLTTGDIKVLGNIDALVKEITDDVIRLLSNSNEALQDFAYIRTQGDVSKFNTKYGVTLVLPAQTA